MKLIGLILTVLISSMTANCQGINSVEDITSKWEMFTLLNEIKVRVLENYPAIALCGSPNVSITIVESEKKDTFRVIQLCNVHKLKYGEIYILKKSNAYSGVQYPYGKNMESRKIQLLSELDNKIKRTTWGTLK